MEVLIRVEGRNILDNTRCSVYLELKLLNGVQTISIKGSNMYDINSVISSWKHPWNINGLSNHKVDVPFSQVLDAIYTIRISSNLKLPWYKKVEELLESLNTL